MVIKLRKAFLFIKISLHLHIRILIRVSDFIKFASKHKCQSCIQKPLTVKKVLSSFAEIRLRHKDLLPLLILHVLLKFYTCLILALSSSARVHTHNHSNKGNHAFTEVFRFILWRGGGTAWTIFVIMLAVSPPLFPSPIRSPRVVLFDLRVFKNAVGLIASEWQFSNTLW